MVACGSGVAVGFDLTRAAVTATTHALAEIDGAVPDLACVFVHGAESDDVTAALMAASRTAGAAGTIGCTATHGVIGGGHGIEDVSAVSVFVAKLPGVRLRAFHLEVMRTADSIAVVGMPDLDGDDQVALVLADAYSFPIEGFVEESDRMLSGLMLAGGMAVGGQGAGSTRLLLDGRVVERGAVGIVLGGGIGVSTMVSQGCRPVGNPMAVTRVEGNVLLELAGRPALQRLEDLLLTLSPEDQAIASGGLYIGVARDEYSDELEQGDFLVRNIIRVDPERHAIVVNDLVEVGQTMRFQLRDAGAASVDLVDGLQRWQKRRELADVKGALLFSCNGRGERFFTTGDHDAVVVRDGLGGAAVAGYFAAGEIGPVAGRNYLHGFSAAVVAFGTPGR
ncbi:MAG TPA: FIST N-terminal domain-containing protein [Actinomycetes bacterium]|nr:FIST N-terminal domain-containing protein [Actinomycetes bacterium]